MQARLPVVPGTSKILLASIEGETFAAGALLGQQALFEGGQRVDSLVAQKKNTQASIETNQCSIGH